MLQSLRRFSMELNKPRSHWTEEGIRGKIAKWLAGQFLSEVIRYQLEFATGSGGCSLISIMPLLSVSSVIV